MKKITLMTMIATTMAMGGCKMQENANTEVITEQAASDNALIAKSNNKHSIESFGKIGVNEYKEAFLKGMEKQNARIKEIINNPDAPTFANTIAALENSGEELERAEYTFEPIENSNSTQELRDLSKEMSPAFSKHNDDIYMNPALFSRVKKVYDDINSTALHSFMRDVHYTTVGDVERDFVELPSQINEHWAFEPEVLDIYAKHYKTGEPLPKELLAKYNAASKYGRALPQPNISLPHTWTWISMC